MPESKPICGIGAYYRMATKVTIENNVKLERLLMSGTNMEKKAIEIMRKLVRQARDEVSQRAQSAIPNDPRKTAHAIRSTVYRAVLGGNVNLLSSRKANAPSSYRPPRRLRPGQVGGNRRPRSRRTEQMLGYVGFDRAFVLRWLDGGTETRTTDMATEAQSLPATGSRTQARKPSTTQRRIWSL